MQKTIRKLLRESWKASTSGRKWLGEFPQIGHPLQINAIGQGEYKRLIAEANMKNIKFHDMRHTCATLLLQAGVPAHVVQERLGHKKNEITLGIYAHVLPSMQQDATTKLALILHK